MAEALLREQAEPEAAIPAAQRLLQIDRAHEGAWRALMRAHAARGERGMAIQAYERCRAVLADLLDAAPSAETQKLLAEIRGPSGSRMPLRPPAPPPPNRADAPTSRRRSLEPRREAPTRGGAHVGVLPLQLVGTTEEEGISRHGLAEEITTALARFRWMFVVSSNSLARFAAETRDETAIRRTFGLDFLLDGSSSASATGCASRSACSICAPATRWCGRAGSTASRIDLLSLQDEIAAEVVAQIDPEILLIEAKRSASRPPIDATAYDLVLRAMPLIGRMERGPFMQAGEYLSRRDRAGARLRRRLCLVRLLAHFLGRPGLGRRPARR